MMNFNQINRTERVILSQLYEILDQIKYDYERLQFNTVVSGCMKLLNLLSKISHVPVSNIPTNANTNVNVSMDPADTDVSTAPGSRTDIIDINIYHYIIHEGISILLRLLAPIVPHITHVIWQDLHYKGVLLDAPMPEGNSTLITMDEVELVVQINGKLRTKIMVPTNADIEIIKKIAFDDAKVQQTIINKNIKKCITVPGRLINIVTD